MIYARSGAEALAERDTVISPGTGIEHWGTVFFGPRTSTTRAPGPQATMSELQAHEALKPHFHGVSMFQLFIAGYGTLGNRGQELKPLTIQFKDCHTTYGPVTAGPQGLSFVALRMYTGDSKPVYIYNKAEAREKIRPSKRRMRVSDQVHFSIEPLLRSRKDVAWETIMEEEDDGLSAKIVRLGANMGVKGPDPKIAGGYYVFVGNGSMLNDGEDLPLWSMVVVENTEEAFEIQAGSDGLEALVLQYPLEDI
ncbi:MAG: hypothetical protein O3A84_04295 [Proteobacteria bacterium]|nr:hypothetical protein [Pseudomonadota bacterium]